MYFPAAFNPERARPPASPRLAPARTLQSLALNGRSGTLRATSESGQVRRAAIPRAEGRNVLIVGAGPVGRELAATLEREHIAGRAVVGFLDETEILTGDVIGRFGRRAAAGSAYGQSPIFMVMDGTRIAALNVAGWAWSISAICPSSLCTRKTSRPWASSGNVCSMCCFQCWR